MYGFEWENAYFKSNEVMTLFKKNKRKTFALITKEKQKT